MNTPRRLGEGFYSHPFVVTFRIDTLTTSKGEYDKRFDDLEAAIIYASESPPWKDPTSCYVFRSGRTTGEIAALVARALHKTKDVALVLRADGPESVLVGNSENEAALYVALPQTTKL